MFSVCLATKREMKNKAEEKKKTISVAIPLYNEEEVVQELYRRLRASLNKDFSQFNHEMIFIDDGSKDSTFELLEELNRKDPDVKVVQFSRNFGHHVAMTAGLDHASGDYVVTMDGDLQDKPEEIIKLYEKLCGGYDVVFCERLNKKFSWFKKKCSKLFLWTIRFLVGNDIEVNQAIMRIMTRQVVNRVNELRERSRYVTGLMGWVGFKHTSVPIEHGERFAGKTKYPFRRQLMLALDAIVSMSDYPLKCISRFGFGMVLFSLLFGAFVVAYKFLGGHPVVGWSSLMVTILFVGGVQVFVVGLLGEYLSRIYMEVKQRPLYVVRRSVGL